MKKNNFILVFLAVIIIIRLIMHFIPRTNLIYFDGFHHIHLGLILVVVYFLIRNRSFSDYFLAIGLGFVVDQVASSPFYVASLLNKPLAPHSFWRYWSPYSMISTLIVVIISLFLINKYKKDNSKTK